jgi:hypothetical protein
MDAVFGAHVHTKQVFTAEVRNHIGQDEIFLNMNWSFGTDSGQGVSK